MPNKGPFYFRCLHFQKKMVFIVSDYQKSYLKKNRGVNKLIKIMPGSGLVNVI